MESSGSWELPEDLRMFRDTVRRFMAEEVKPVEDKLPHDAYTLEPEPLKALQRKARDLGLWCLETPAEHGGFFSRYTLPQQAQARTAMLSRRLQAQQA